MPTLRTRHTDTPPRRSKPNKAFYQSSRWHRLSLAYRKNNRLCVECLKEGITKLSEEVDHIIPIVEGGNPWDLNNLQALCKSHHSQKTKREQKKKHEE
jgi:5-methylcytosine-specific restriction protein A